MAAISPRTRNRRRGGARSKEERDEADDPDVARSAPRSDLDNNDPGGEEAPWETSSAGRASPMGGTRTHKSTTRSAGSRRDPTRSRSPSPKAPPSKDDDDGKNAVGDDEGGNSPLPSLRDRKNVRAGGWERDVARSNAMLSKPRKRKPRGGDDRSRGSDGDDGDEQDVV